MIRNELDLLDTAKTIGASGSIFAALANELQLMDDNTHILEVRAKAITFLSIANLEKYSEPGKTAAYVLSDEYVKAFVERGEKLHLVMLDDEKIGAELVAEAKRTSGLIALIDGVFYTVSASAISTLSLRCGVSGNNTAIRSNIARDLHVADGCFINNEKITVVYRKAFDSKAAGGAVYKIFAFLGTQYRKVPQKTLTRVLEKVGAEYILGTPALNSYEISQEFTDIYVDFPDAAADFKATYGLSHDVVPGLFLCTSDTGASSVIVRGTYRIGKSYVIVSELMRKHTSGISAEEIVKEADEVIFPQFRKLPETLSELMGLPVVNYTALDLTSAEGAEKNFEKVSGLIMALSKKLFTAKVLGGKQRKLLEGELIDEINSSVHYTYYDIALTFMGIPERLSGLARPTKDEISKACAKAPFTLLDMVKKSETEEERPILLSA